MSKKTLLIIAVIILVVLAGYYAYKKWEWYKVDNSITDAAAALKIINNNHS